MSKDKELPMPQTLEESTLDTSDTLEVPWSFDVEDDDRQRKVLVVDDEIHILKAVRRLFIGQSYEVVSAQKGSDAVEILKKQSIAVLISDQRMPGMSGVELLDFARRNCPKTVRIMLTGNNDVTTAIEAINDGQVFRFITKPWDHDEFVRIVDMAIEQHELLDSKERYEAHIEAQNDQLRRFNTKLHQLNNELEARVEQRTKEVVAQKHKISELYDNLQDSFDGMIKALLSIMELGDIHIIEHCQRTAERVKMFGDFLGYDEGAIHEIERAALLHWIGLINASPSMFRKVVDDFDAVEAATWEFHPLLGQQAIRHVSALQQVGRFILHYLNRYDDPGFLPGKPSLDEWDKPLTEEFIASCQVLAICSIFERVRTSSSRGEVSEDDWVDEGLRVVEAGRAKRFAPELVDQFAEMMAKEVATSRSRDVVVTFDELEPGMVLARPLETAQGIPVAPRDMIITAALIERLQRFRDSNGLNEIHVWD